MISFQLARSPAARQPFGGHIAGFIGIGTTPHYVHHHVCFICDSRCLVHWLPSHHGSSLCVCGSEQPHNFGKRGYTAPSGVPSDGLVILRKNPLCKYVFQDWVQKQTYGRQIWTFTSLEKKLAPNNHTAEKSKAFQNLRVKEQPHKTTR